MKERIYRYTKTTFRLAVKAVGTTFGLIACGLLILIGSRKGCRDLDELIEIFNGVSSTVEAMIVRAPTALICLLAYICAFIDEFIISPIVKLVNLVLFPIKGILPKRVAADDVESIKDEQAKTRIGIVKNRIKSILSRVIYEIIYWNAEVMQELLDEKDAKERIKAENAEYRKKNKSGRIDAEKKTTARVNETVARTEINETADSEALNSSQSDTAKNPYLPNRQEENEMQVKKVEKEKIE